MRLFERIFLFIKERLKNHTFRKVCLVVGAFIVLTLSITINASAYNKLTYYDEFQDLNETILESTEKSIESIIESSEPETSETINSEVENVSSLVSEEKTSEEASSEETIIEDSEVPAVAKPSNNSSSTSNNNPNTFDEYVGRFKIPAVGVNVGCYASASQATVDATDSAAYFYTSGHLTIADHKHQGFSAIKSCSKGMKATLSVYGETRTYTCVAKITGHNTGKILTDDNYNSIADLYPGTLICYTCNDNWQNVTIVFFSLGDGEYVPPSEDIGWGCGEGQHAWSDWKIEWEGETGGRKFHWESHECKICHDEEWELVYDTEIPEGEPETSEEVTNPSEEESVEIPSENEISSEETTVPENSEETESSEDNEELSTEDIEILVEELSEEN